MITLISDVSGRFGINPRETERFVKFLVVGAIGFIVDFGIFNILIGPFTAMVAEGTWVHHELTLIGLSPNVVVRLGAALAGAVSFFAAVTSNFLWNRYWTYPDSRSKSRRRQFAMFGTVSVVGILIRVPIIMIASPIFLSLISHIRLFQPYAVRISENMALALAVVIVLFWNFFANRYWTYNDVE